MGYYAIGIGGTGAKVLESIVHLAAAGLMPGAIRQFIFVDSDNDNGSRTRAENTVAHYRACKTHLQLGDSNLLKTGIEEAKHWTPFNEPNSNLEGCFRYNMLSETEELLFDVLYSKAERQTTLEKGFHAHPSIGAAVMAQAVDLNNVEPWQTLQQIIEQDQNPRIFLAGSIFGGTGASGFPTIAKLLRDNLPEQTKLGGALILPYFKFIYPQAEVGGEQPAQLRAESQHFLMNTQAALKYYGLQHQTNSYNAVYILGSEHPVLVDPSPGGAEQKNAPHFIELYAALAAIDFFEKNDFDENNPYHLIARADRQQLSWADLPSVANGNEIQSRIGQLARFAFAYLHIYQPTLQEILGDESKRNNAAWFNTFFKFSEDKQAIFDFRHKDKIVVDDNTAQKLNAIEVYCRDFLLWLANIQVNCGNEDGNNEAVHLIQHSAFAKDEPAQGSLVDLKPVTEFESQHFGRLIPNVRRSGSTAELWGAMSRRNLIDPEAKGFGKFFSALYNNCQL